MSEPKRVLIVAENPASCDRLADELDVMMRGPFDTIATESTAEGLSLLETTRFDAIVCDLPASRGADFLNLVSLRYPAMCGVFLATAADFDAIENPLHSSRFTVLFHPVDPEKLRCWARNAVTMTAIKRDTDRLRAKTIAHRADHSSETS